jgi:hypothetical protein
MWLASFRLLIDKFPVRQSMLSDLAAGGHLNYGKTSLLKSDPLETRPSLLAGRMATLRTKQ